jgi:hypothetical protein
MGKKTGGGGLGGSKDRQNFARRLRVFCRDVMQSHGRTFTSGAECAQQCKLCNAKDRKKFKGSHSTWKDAEGQIRDCPGNLMKTQYPGHKRKSPGSSSTAPALKVCSPFSSCTPRNICQHTFLTFTPRNLCQQTVSLSLNHPSQSLPAHRFLVSEPPHQLPNVATSTERQNISCRSACAVRGWGRVGFFNFHWGLGFWGWGRGRLVFCWCQRGPPSLPRWFFPHCTCSSVGLCLS